MQDAKTIETTEHEDGRKDVHITVNRLDLDKEPEDKEGIVAKEAIEKQMFARLAEQGILVIVLHKPTNQEAHHVVKPQNIRAFAEAAVRKFLKLDGDQPLTQDATDDFAVIENNLTNQTVKITTL